MDEGIKVLNCVVEDVVKEVILIFVLVVKNMLFMDVKNILLGNDSVVMSYL